MTRKFKYMGATPSPGVENYPIQLWDSLVGTRHPALDSRRHLDAAMSWLAAAQDAGDDDGLARMYHIRNGWGSSYPETTGYAIPTFLSYAELAGLDEYSSRAIRMAKWETAVQMKSGAVQGGVISDEPTPAIFNTGQVIFGWMAAYAKTESPEFLESALRAADYLVANMDEDGAWRKNLSAFTTAAIDTYAYNVRSAWALLLVRDPSGNDSYRKAALKNVDFVLSLCQDNGWIRKNCLGRPEQPLLHTIAYAYQGLLEIAVREGRDDAMETVLRGNSELLRNFEDFGRLHGRYEQGWSPTVGWRCLTGEAQTAVVWQRLASVTGESRWRSPAAKLLNQLKKTQKLSGPVERRGGIKGAQPITAPYGALSYLNWAAKFFADGLLLELGADSAAYPG